VWESCLVEVDPIDLAVEAAANMYNEFPVGDGTDTFNVDDLLYDASASVGAGSAITYLAGIVNYAFEEWKLLPRDAGDILADVAPITIATIGDLQDGLVTEDTAVFDVENAVVAAIYITGTGLNQKTNFWIQQGSGPNSGVLVFDLAKLHPTVAVGDTVNIRGVSYDEFKGAPGGTPWTESMTEIVTKTTSTVEVTASGAVPAVTTISLADLLADAESYESVLVSLDDAAISVDNLNPDAPSDFKEYTITNGAETIRVNDVLFETRTGKVTAQALTTRIGVLEYANNNFKLEPRAAADMQ
jgi:hypothetical protein